MGDLTDSELIRLAIAHNVDPAPHLCGCEVCSHTSRLCPATRSSLMMAIQENEGRANE